MVSVIYEVDSSFSTGYLYATNTIKQLEQSLYSNSDISSVEKNRFFKFSSVARYSTYYWFDQLYNDGDWKLTFGLSWNGWGATISGYIWGTGFGLTHGAGAFGPWGIVGTAAVGSAMGAFY